MSISPNNDAFVILPFEEEFEKLYHDKIVPLLEDNNYSVMKADSLAAQRNIIEDIVNGIVNADLIIADLTGTNPNVFYELGIAHGLGIPTVLIAQDIEELPFDLSAYKTIEYSLRYDKIEEFCEELSEICSGHKEGEIEFGSPVSDYTKVNINEPNNETNHSDRVANSSEDQDGVDINEADDSSDKTKETDYGKGIIEHMITVEDHEKNLHNIMEEFIDGSSSTRSNIARDVDKLKSMYNKNKAEARRDINDRSRDISDNIAEYAMTIRQELQSFELYHSQFVEKIQQVIEQADASKKSDRKILIELQEKVDDFTNKAEKMLEELEEFKNMLKDIKGINSKLDDAIDSLNKTTSTFERILHTGLAKGERYDSLIKNKIEDSSD